MLPIDAIAVGFAVFLVGAVALRWWVARPPPDLLDADTLVVVPGRSSGLDTAGILGWMVLAPALAFALLPRLPASTAWYGWAALIPAWWLPVVGLERALRPAPERRGSLRLEADALVLKVDGRPDWVVRPGDGSRLAVSTGWRRSSKLQDEQRVVWEVTSADGRTERFRHDDPTSSFGPGAPAWFHVTDDAWLVPGGESVLAALRRWGLPET